MAGLETYTALFIVIAAGLALGKIKVKGVSLGTSSVIFVAIFLGHFGLQIPAVFKNIGLILFMYSVGIQAGPGFFEIFKNKKKHVYFYLTFLMIFLEAILTLGAKYIFGYDSDIAAGLFAGALSSSAGLAAAASGGGSELVSAVFGLAYPFGVLLIVIFMILAPRFFKINIKSEEENYLRAAKAMNPDIFVKSYLLENKNIFGKTLAAVEIRNITGATISCITNGEEEISITADTVLNEGYILWASGTPSVHEKLSILIGSEQAGKVHATDKYVVRHILITNKVVINQSLNNLALSGNYGASITQIRRSGVDIVPRPHIKLRFGDKVTLACPTNNIEEVVKLLGGSRSKINDLDLLPISIGILLGVLIGSIAIPIGDFTLKFGLTGGVLISGIILGRIGKTGSIIWNVSGVPNMFLRKFGLIFFLAAVGSEAGANFVDLFYASGMSIIGSSIVIVLLPLFLAAWIGYRFLKIDFLTLLGILTGSMTSTPGLSSIENLSDTNAARVAYAAVYPLALVLVMFVCQLMLML